MIKWTNLASRQTHLRSNVVLDQPVEPIICWLDSGCESREQVRPVHRPFALLFTIISLLIAGGSALAAWNHNRAAESRLSQSSAANANWDTTDMRRLVPTLAAAHVRAIAAQSKSRSNNSATDGQTNECGPASARLCPEDSLFRQLPDLMKPSKNNDTVLQRRESSPYRELELLPRPAIVPVMPPDTGDILLERHPGDPG